MRNILIKIRLSCIILTSCILLAGCWPVHNGSIIEKNYADLFQVAAYSSFCVAKDTGSKWLNIIEPIEQDSYGRTLCSYADNVDFEIWFKNCTGFFIVQSSSDHTVWFYEDCCFKAWPEGENTTPEEIEELKALNDWDQPLDKSKMSKLEYKGISYCREPESGNWYQEEDAARTAILQTPEIQPLIEQAGTDKNTDLNYPFKCEYLSQDSEGKRIFLFYLAQERDKPHYTYGPFFIYILMPDGSYECAEITDPFNCSQELCNLKKDCNWQT